MNCLLVYSVFGQKIPKACSPGNACGDFPMKSEVSLHISKEQFLQIIREHLLDRSVTQGFKGQNFVFMIE